MATRPRPNYLSDATMVDFEAGIMPYVVTDLPGCPDPLIKQFARETVREICEDTLQWQVELWPMSLIKGQNDYDLVIEDDSDGCYEIEKVMEVWVKGSQKTALRDYYLPSFNQLFMTGAPGATEAGKLEIRVAIKPKPASKEIEERFFNEWIQLIRFGILYKLKAQPDKTWTDAQGAAFYRSEYQRETSEMEAQRILKDTTGVLIASFSNFSGSGSGGGRRAISGNVTI